MGLTLRLLADHPAALAAAESALRGFGPPLPSPAPDLTFRLLASTPASLSSPAFASAGAHPEPAYLESGARVLQRAGSAARLVADRAAGLAWGRFSPCVLESRAYFRIHFLELALFVMLAPRGLMGVHASAWVRDGRAVLLRAPGRGGKTTLAYAAARGRFRALSEDVVWIDEARGRWWGTPWWFHLRPDAGELFPELAAHPPDVVLRGEPKLAVEMESVRPGSTVAQAIPGPVVLVARRSGGPSRLEPLGLLAALDRWAAGRAGTEEDFPDYGRRVRALLADNAWALDLGDGAGEIERALDLVEPLLER
ncbi:MAG TPA: hypothetical protein VIH93_17200 [Thermoanaerobaculia bacterium]